MALTASTAPLIWMDCEMTGLDPETDRILSLSCFITTHDLRFVDETGYHATIATPRDVLDGMGEWCQRTHTATGLVEKCLGPEAVSAERASRELLRYVRRYVPEKGVGMLAGNSVHADKMFLMKGEWVGVLEWLHYRILDVSAIKEGVRRWCGEDVIRGVPGKKGVHSAEDDVRESIEEARYYMGLFQNIRTGGPEAL